MEYHTDMKKPKRKTAESEEPRPKHEKKEFKLPFRPAALKKCEAFQADELAYGEDKERLKSFRAQSKEERKTSKEKFKPVKMKGQAEHTFAFKPPNVIKLVI